MDSLVFSYGYHNGLIINADDLSVDSSSSTVPAKKKGGKR
jgi:hypothetical protein